MSKPRPISNQPVVVGFPHRAGQYRPKGTPFLVEYLKRLTINLAINIVEQALKEERQAANRERMVEGQQEGIHAYNLTIHIV